MRDSVVLMMTAQRIKGREEAFSFGVCHAPSSNSALSGISSRGSSQHYPSSSLLDIMVDSPSSPLPTPLSPRVHQASVNNLQAQKLEMHATHAFEHVSEVQSYAEQKIAILETNLRMAETNLMEAYKEIDRWRELY
ncbi:hypothetical protein TorRG33x02_311680 [Trema orientale]|uniref:Uncharacterized protein n=1 Tax=Trema orientale TaxID=63057 RepID=A0A2P5BRE1_TREOI|nr:hypothetical protein TorRG33x02_311680 [Trema orientale]